MYDYDRRRFAMEHTTPEARKEYLKDHPNADPKNHTVRERKVEKGTPTKDTSAATSKARGKGGPGKQRVDWVNQLKKDHKPKSLDEEDAVRHLNTEAVQYDKFEKRYEDGPTESLLKTLQHAFKTYNKKLKEAFGEDAMEKEPKWELPKAKPKDSEAPKPKEKAEKKKLEWKDSWNKEDPDKGKKKKPELNRDVEKKIEDKYGYIYEAHYDDWGDKNKEGEHSFSVETEKGEVYVTVDSKTGDIIKMSK